LAKRIPCVVCGDPNIIGAGTWIPDERRMLAAGGTRSMTPVFSFCLCRKHAEGTEENETLISRAILRDVRSGKKWDV